MSLMILSIKRSCTIGRLGRKERVIIFRNSKASFLRNKRDYLTHGLRNTPIMSQRKLCVFAFAPKRMIIVVSFFASLCGMSCMSDKGADFIRVL